MALAELAIYGSNSVINLGPLIAVLSSSDCWLVALKVVMAATWLQYATSKRTSLAKASNPPAVSSGFPTVAADCFPQMGWGLRCIPTSDGLLARLHCQRQNLALTDCESSHECQRKLTLNGCYLSTGMSILKTPQEEKHQTSSTCLANDTPRTPKTR